MQAMRAAGRGFIRAFCILFAAVFLTSCNRAQKVNSSRFPVTTFLALGDSYTIGESVKEAERWPVQLAGMARAKGYSIDEPRIIARTGWTIDELQAAVDGSGT